MTEETIAGFLQSGKKIPGTLHILRVGKLIETGSLSAILAAEGERLGKNVPISYFKQNGSLNFLPGAFDSFNPLATLIGQGEIYRVMERLTGEPPLVRVTRHRIPFRGKSCWLYYDYDGQARNLPPNELATALYRADIRPARADELPWIAGDALVLEDVEIG